MTAIHSAASGKHPSQARTRTPPARKFSKANECGYLLNLAVHRSRLAYKLPLVSGQSLEHESGLFESADKLLLKCTKASDKGAFFDVTV